MTPARARLVHKGLLSVAAGVSLALLFWRDKTLASVLGGVLPPLQRNGS